MSHKPKKNLSAYISLGSNSGDAINNLEKALQEIKLYAHGQVGAVSSIYKTEPQDDKDQNWFHNQLIRFDFTHLTECQNGEQNAQNLNFIENEANLFLKFLLNIETKMGRSRDPLRRFGPRIIDLDIILFGNHCINNENLIVPHPRFLKRAFILIPLQEIEPSCILADNINISDALAHLSFTIDGDKIYQ